jgi:type I restriction enzyme S subunit
MNYLRIPKEIHHSEIKGKEASWSPSMYRRVIIPTSTVKRAEDLLDDFIQGTEVGSLAYVQSSPFNFIRTKAIQDYTFLTYPKGDSVPFITPKAYSAALKSDPKRKIVEGDMLYTRGGAVGQVAVAYGFGDAITSSHILKLIPKEHPLYLLAFLRHPICRLQQDPAVKGAIRALDNWNKGTLLNCLVPFPNQPDSDRVVNYVSALMQAIVEKEKTIRGRNALIDSIIEAELSGRQYDISFQYSFPTVSEMTEMGRLDASMYSEDFKRKEFLIKNYSKGWQTYEQMEFKIGRGQNLQISCIGKSIYSDSPKPGFYRLAAPTDLSEFRTIREFRYLGSKKDLARVKRGDVIFGAEGFCKGRAVILADDVERTITNIHGVVFHPRDGNITKGIFFGCFLGYLRSVGLVDAIGAGGSGGSLAIGYFDHVPIPKFPEEKQAEIARLYHHDASPPPGKPTIESLVDWHRRWNAALGIWELDREMKVLQRTLMEVQERIIEGKTVDIKYDSP